MYDRHDHFGAYGTPAEQYDDAYAALSGQWDGYSSADQWNGYGSAFGQEPFSAPDLDVLQGRWEPDVELTQLLQETPDPVELPPPAMDLRRPPTIGPSCHRRRPMHKVKPRAWKLVRNQSLNYAIATVSVVIIAVVSVLGCLLTHEILRHAAAPGAAYSLSPWWPALVYGPWTVASLSILRATLHRRRAPHAWAIALFFCVLAALTCIAAAPRTLSGAGVAALPAIATMACFHQLVRHITLTRPARREVGFWCKSARPCSSPDHSESL
ncbi:DUF2637 domain-containing protein [Streptomyces sp. NBC_01210]|uniref:DUF2637 domain-containing protein n=1 Tax=Streptomyces sp. NBC_01210 TaxID=2903774 RepID=UPI002E10C471|nr:DUF2637 domain-containing protein [Streptomyces sp. NBC_01210]